MSRPETARSRQRDPASPRSDVRAGVAGSDFAARLVAWHATQGRHDLPWQVDRDPYRVWLSEVMLQQTQVAVVIPYFARFCDRFPDVATLAAAPIDDVLTQWAGLGYYARARNLHASARRIVEKHGGHFPLDPVVLARLPGIGRSTAGAIAAFCAGARAPILDGNVRRVLMRQFAIAGRPGVAAVERQLWRHAEALLPDAKDMPAYTQAIMDLGATVCLRRSPRCGQCPVATGCSAWRLDRVDQIPEKRARPPLRERRAWALLALHDDRVLLQRLAPAGVWGGLHTLPQFDSAAALRSTAAAIDAGTRLRALPPRTHVFTHFRLTLLPRRLDVRAPPTVLHDNDLLWLPLAEIDSAPLPAPIVSLLRDVAAQSIDQSSPSGVIPRATRKRDTML